MNIPWTQLAPELVLVIAIPLVLLIDLLLKQDESRFLIYLLTLVSLGVSAYYVLSQINQPAVSILQDTYRIEKYSQGLKIIILFGTALVVLLSSSFVEERKKAKGEFYTLLLSATLGAMVISSSYDLITLFVGMELLSLASYILVGLRKERMDSNESAWKYVIYGGVSAAFFLYGSSFLYGLTGSTNLAEISSSILGVYQMGYGPYLYLAFFLILVGIGFKIATAPFHMWVPDVYQGASGSVLTFLAVVSKASAFMLALRVLLIPFQPLTKTGEWEAIMHPALLTLAFFSMLWGSIVALRQTDVKRILAYSSITHAGYLLVALLGDFHLSTLFFYLITYTFMTAGAFAVVSIIENQEQSTSIDSFAGLAKRSPILALVMGLFLISMAGIPLTGGFMGKFYILLGALAVKYYVLVAVILLSTVISYAVYFRLIRQMYFLPAKNSSGKKIPIPIGAGLVLLVSVIGTLALGIVPQMVLDRIQTLF